MSVQLSAVDPAARYRDVLGSHTGTRGIILTGRVPPITHSLRCAHAPHAEVTFRAACAHRLKGDVIGIDMIGASEARYRGLLEAAPDAMIVVDRAGLIVTSNLRASRQFGYDPGELEGDPVTTIIPTGFAERLRSDDLRSVADARNQEIGTGIELVGRRKDHTEFPIQLMLSPLDTGAGVLVTAAIRAVGESGAAQMTPIDDSDPSRVALNSIGDGVGCTDLKGRITFLNVVAERLTGWSLDEALGRPMEEVIRIVNAQTEELIPDLTNRAVRGDKTVHLPPDSVLVTLDGHHIPIEDSTAPIHDGNGQATGAVIVFRDVSAALAAAQELAHAAHHDFLTGLPNRMLLDDHPTSSSGEPRVETSHCPMPIVAGDMDRP